MSPKYLMYALYYSVLQQFGVIPFEIRTLKIGHTEQRRRRRFYITAIVRHRGTVGAWRHRGYLRVLLMSLSTSFQSIGLQDFLKRLLPKLSATRTLRLCRSLCLRHLCDIVCFHLRVPPLCVPFICSRLTLSLHISEKPKNVSNQIIHTSQQHREDGRYSHSAYHTMDRRLGQECKFIAHCFILQS